MKHYFLSIILICFQLTIWAQGINFEKGNFEELKVKAKKENKLIFVDAYTTWCGPCKWMASTVFTNDTVGKFYNEHFISAKIDMEKGEGIEFAKKYNVRCYPNLIILNGDGEVIHRQGGGLKPQAFIEFATKAMKGEKTFSFYNNAFINGSKDLTFLKEYIDYLGHTCLPMDEQINAYFNYIDSTQYSERNNWNMLLNYANSTESKPFKYLLKHQFEFSSKYTQDSVDMKITHVFQKKAQKYIYANPLKEKELDIYLKQIEDMNLPQSKSIIFAVKLDLFVKKGDWLNYENEILKNGDQLLAINQYNAVAWNLYEKSNNDLALSKAALWMKKLTESQSESTSNYAELDTYACVLYKLKKKEEALKIAEKAIEKAKKMGMKESQYEETLELINKIKLL
jgi:thiol-disulfide isomerase/thioredoxin